MRAERMRVLHVVPTYIPATVYGGPLKSVHGICRGLAQLGHDVHVYTTDVNGCERLDVPHGVQVDVEGVKVRYFPCGGLARIYYAPQMRKALEREVASYDIVHLHSVFLWPTMVAARAARRFDVPYVLAPRGMLVGDLIRRKSRWAKTFWIEAFERKNVREAACIHFTSDSEAAEGRKLGLQIRGECIVPNALGEDDFQLEDPTAAPGPCNGRYLLFLGRVNWVKGLDRLIEAMRHVPTHVLVIAGNDDGGYQVQLETQVRKAGLQERVHFCGPVHGASKRALIRGADAVVLPSYSESFGNVVLEAMAMERAVFVTPEVGAADLVRSTGSGFVLDGNPERLGRGIAAALADDENLSAMGRAGRAVVQARFSWDAVAREMADAYRYVLSPERP